MITPAPYKTGTPQLVATIQAIRALIDARDDDTESTIRCIAVLVQAQP